jgi:carboxypeptidase family protein
MMVPSGPEGADPARDLHAVSCRAMRACVLLLAFPFACSKPQKPRPLGVPGRIGTAAITGVVTRAAPVAALPQQRGAFAGCPPAPPRAEPVTAGKVNQAFVHVADGLPPGDYPLPPQPVTLDQKGCEFSPRVFGIRAGQDLLVRNDDPTDHNVHSLAPGKDAFNFGVPQKLGKTIFFAEPRAPATIACDLHPWMRAYAGISPHPFFAVTGADGSFALRGLPAGTYTVEAWQERLGRGTARVTVRDGQTTPIQISLDAAIPER